MSGGHFDYKSFQINDFADLLKHELEINDCQRVDKCGDTIGYNFDEETVDVQCRCLNWIQKAADLAKEVEWLYSGDHGEDSFRELVDKIL